MTKLVTNLSGGQRLYLPCIQIVRVSHISDKSRIAHRAALAAAQHLRSTCAAGSSDRLTRLPSTVPYLPPAAATHLLLPSTVKPYTLPDILPARAEALATTSCNYIDGDQQMIKPP